MSTGVITYTQDDALFFDIVKVLLSRYPRTSIKFKVLEEYGTLQATIYDSKTKNNVLVKAKVIEVAGMQGIVSMDCIKSMYRQSHGISGEKAWIECPQFTYSPTSDRLMYNKNGFVGVAKAKAKQLAESELAQELKNMDIVKAAEYLNNILSSTVVSILQTENAKFKAKEDIIASEASQGEENAFKKFIEGHWEWVYSDALDNMKNFFTSVNAQRKGEKAAVTGDGTVSRTLKTMRFLDCCKIQSPEAGGDKGGILGFFIGDMMKKDGEEGYPVLIYAIWSKLLEYADELQRKNLINNLNTTSAVVFLTKEKIKKLSEDLKESRVLVDAVTKKRNKLFYSSLMSDTAQSAFLSAYGVDSTATMSQLERVAQTLSNDANQDD